MPSLSSYINVYGTAVTVIRGKGFQIWTDETEENWFAERSGWDFQADNPIELLGLIGIFETLNPTTHSEYWWRDSDAVNFDLIPKQPAPYSPVVHRKA